MSLADLDFRLFLRDVLKERQVKNPSYSMSAFARDLKMSPQKLSQVLKGISGLSVEAARETSKRLALDPSEADLFVALVGTVHARSHELKRIYAETVRRLLSLKSAAQKQPNEFAPLADALTWTCFLLVDTVDFKPEMSWVAQRAGASVEDCQKAFDRLFESGLIVVKDSGLWVQNHSLLQYAFPSSGPEIRKFYSEMLARATTAVENVPYDSRYNHVVMLPVSEEVYAEMKLKIDEFAQSLLEQYSSQSARATRVYACSVSLFPLDRKLES